MNHPYCWYWNGVENWLNQEDNKLRNLEKDSDACILEAEVDNFKLEKVIAWDNKTEKTFKSKSTTALLLAFWKSLEMSSQTIAEVALRPRS